MSFRPFAFLMWCLFLLFPWASGQEMVEEKVAVNWWVVPLIAIEQGENPARNLTSADISLRVDGKTIGDFQVAKLNLAGTATVAEAQQAPVVKKMAFFIFDTALSSPGVVNYGKLIAEEIVQEADPATQFGIVVIDATRGLQLISVPLADHKTVLDLLASKVKANPFSVPYSRAKAVEEARKMLGADGGGKSRYSGRDIEWFAEQHSKTYISKINNFFESFESFYYMVSGIQEKKFFYLFSEGLSNDAMKLLTEVRYVNKIKETARFLSRANGLVFIVDPAGVRKSVNDSVSGEQSLHMMAAECGGKYLQGETDRIVEKIRIFDRAYYEIAFPAPKRKRASLLHIEIKAKRSGLEIYSPSLLALPKALMDMNTYEAEVFVQQCLRGTLPLQGGYTLYHERVVFQGAVSEGEARSVSLRIPAPLRHRELAVFWGGYNSAGQMVRLNKGTGQTGNELLTLAIPAENEAVAEQIEWRLVILDIKGNAALICDDAIALH